MHKHNIQKTNNHLHIRTRKQQITNRMLTSNQYMHTQQHSLTQHMLQNRFVYTTCFVLLGIFN